MNEILLYVMDHNIKLIKEKVLFLEEEQKKNKEILNQLMLKVDKLIDPKKDKLIIETQTSFKVILDNFKSCIAQGNGELESDRQNIQVAEKILLDLRKY